MAWIRTLGWKAAALAALVLTGLVPVLAGANTGITLNRAPSPPQAILQSGIQQLSYTITFNTTAVSLRLSIFNPVNVLVVSDERTSIQNSPAQGAYTFSSQNTLGGGPLAVGRWRAQVDFFSTPNPAPGSPESSANVAFDVADALGTLTLIKCEDQNGNGVCDPGEPRLPDWVFQLVNPQGNPSVLVTGADGTVTLNNVPAGTWQVTEVMEPGWIPMSPASGTLTVPSGGVGVFAAANARPSEICGVVFLDLNRNGIIDPGEQGYPGATLTLGGGQPATTTSGPGGAYCFQALPPGTYSVSVTVPGGLVNTTALTIPNIALRSAVPSNNNNFGLAPPAPETRTSPPTVTQQGSPAPSPDVRIGKTAPRRVRVGATFDYTIVVRNRSNFTARNVVVSDLVPIQLTLVRIPARASVRNGVVTWQLGDLPRGATRTLRMRVRVNPQFTGVIPNTATVTARGMGPRRSTARTRVVGAPPEPRSGGVTG